MNRLNVLFKPCRLVHHNLSVKSYRRFFIAFENKIVASLENIHHNVHLFENSWVRHCCIITWWHMIIQYCTSIALCFVCSESICVFGVWKYNTIYDVSLLYMSILGSMQSSCHNTQTREHKEISSHSRAYVQLVQPCTWSTIILPVVVNILASSIHFFLLARQSQ